jgi:hypothetical protein
MSPTFSPDRTALREALAGLASRTQTKLPALNGRVEKACKLVLAGDVELHEDGTALVNSLSDPTRAYQLAQVEAAAQWLKAQAPQAPAQAQENGEGKPPDVPQCPQHGAKKPSTKGKGYYCPHKLADGTWCKGR